MKVGGKKLEGRCEGESYFNMCWFLCVSGGGKGGESSFAVGRRNGARFILFSERQRSLTFLD